MDCFVRELLVNKGLSKEGYIYPLILSCTEANGAEVDKPENNTCVVVIVVVFE